MIFTDPNMQLVFFAFVGVAISFGRAKEADKKALGLSPLLGRFITHERGLMIVEALVFLSLGCMISMGVTNPSTVPQALAAGLAWTGIAMGKP